ncbi:MAG: type II secretion system F family protein [Candidatus Uhrbacteria bacterium]|nr:type II secretion system F family protein [Candidatus Uhrbacteria bacterium]
MPKARKKPIKKIAGAPIKKTPWYKRQLNFGRVKFVDIVMSTKHLSVMLESGLTAPESIEVLVEQSSGSLRGVMQRVLQRINSGSSLGDAIALEPKVFSTIYVSAVVIGENSGNLSENLERLADQMEKDLRLRRSIQSAMLYPGIVFTLALVLGFMIATLVLPQISGVFSSLRVDLPLSTRILMYVADIFEKNGFLITASTFGGIIAFIWLVRQKFMRPIVHRALLRIPIVKEFVHELNRARFCRTLGTLLESGTPIEEALNIAAEAMPNLVYRNSIREMHEKIGSGASFSEIIILYPALYPQMIHRMVAVGERSGSLGETLTYLAGFYEERVEVLAKNLSSVLEPVLLIIIGIGVAFIASAILTPIYSILSAVRA